MPSERLDGARLRVACGELDHISKVVAKEMRDEMYKISSDLKVYTFKDRHKETNGIYEKVRLKREAGNPDYSPDMVEDAWGCRYVTLFQAEIGDVVSELIDHIVASAGSLAPLSLEQAVIYSNRPKHDPLAMQRIFADIIHESALPAELKDRFTLDKLDRQRHTGYSSVHLVLGRKVKVDLGGGEVARLAKFEVQVRDVFEEAWSEISHRLSYKRAGTSEDVAGGPDPAWRTAQSRSLNALKASADACSQHATVFDRNMSYWLDTAGLEGKDLSVSSIDEDIANMRQALPAEAGEAMNSIAAGYRMLQAAHHSAVKSIDNRQSKKFYETAAAKFDEAISKLTPEQLQCMVGKGTPMPAEYYLRIEHANALWRGASGADAPEIVHSAVKVYEKLLEVGVTNRVGRYDGDSTIPLRYAQSLNHLAAVALASDSSNNVPSAKQWLTSAVSNLQNALKLCEDDPLLKGNIEKSNWLKIEANRALGVARYRLARLIADSSEKEAVLVELIEFSEKLVEGVRPQIRYSNGYLASAHMCIGNCLYYHWELCELRRKRNSQYMPSSAVVDRVKSYIEMLQRKPYKRLLETHTETIDNIMVAAQMIGDSATAKLMASKNEHKFREIAETRRLQEAKTPEELAAELDVFRYLDKGEEIEMFERAMIVLYPLSTAHSRKL